MKPKRYLKKDLKIFKDILLKMKTKLLEQIFAIEKENLRTSQKDASGDLSGYSIHPADLATDSYDREFSLSRVSGEQKILYQIEDALKRLREGKYGICMGCEGQIAKVRLKAVPYAKFCVKCQNMQERGGNKKNK